MRQKGLALAGSILVLLSITTITYAWNDLGHRVVAQIAWDRLDNDTKAKIIQALKSAPSDSQILRGMPANKNSWPSDVGHDMYAELFQSIGTWPDYVRKQEGHPRATDKYHHGDWHYINVFWNHSDGDLTDDPRVGRLITKLTEFTGGNSAENEAVQLAWLVHLIGDIHQPLHCSARVTDDDEERDGDRGGNEFCLEAGCRDNYRKLNLHSFWDSSLTRNYDPLSHEDAFEQSVRLAGIVVGRYPASGYPDTEGFSTSKQWSDEGVRKAIDNAYPTSLRRNRIPSKTYRRNTLKVSEKAIALAGYRLAGTFAERFDD